ncbi:PAS-domain containing protein, partial [Telmatospirillum sp.]|uniref:PAS-domain containing protein n=1 Tax=Telmatospirillum sp. TaxID=2079197 RepID=UPI002842D3A7
MTEAINQVVTTMPRNTRKAALAIIFAVVVVAGLQSAADFRRETTDAEHLVNATANALDYQASRTLRMIDDLLADATQRVDPVRWPDREVLPWFEGRLGAFPEINNALVIRADGQTAGTGVTADGELGTVLDVTAREYFQYHMSHPNDRGIHIGDPFASRVDGKLAIPVSRAIFDRDGKLIGLIRVLLNPQFLISGMATAVAGPDGFNAAVSLRGVILARSPDPEGVAGRSIATSTAFTQILTERRGGVGEFPSPLSGQTNIIAYRTLDRYPLLILAGQPYWDALADWRAQLLRMLVVVGIFSIALYLVASRSDRRESVRAQLAVAAARAQMQMVQSQQQLIDALESLDDAIAVYDAGNRLVAFNQAYADGFDGARHDIRVGATYEEILRAAYRWHSGTDDILGFESWSSDQIARHNQPTGKPWVIQEPDGRWIQERRCRTAGDGVIEIRADITTLKNREELNKRELERLVAERTEALEQEVNVRRKTEEALRVSRERLKKITDSLFEAVLVIDRAGIIQFVNPSVSRQMPCGIMEGELEGCHLDDVLRLRTAEGDLRLEASPWQRVWSDGKIIQDDDAEFASPSGETVSVAYACMPLREGSSDRSSVILSFRNTDALKAAQREVIQAQRLASVGQLAAGIAHEINTPIQYVGDNLQFIGGAIDTMEHALRALGVIPPE